MALGCLMSKAPVEEEEESNILQDQMNPPIALEFRGARDVRDVGDSGLYRVLCLVGILGAKSLLEDAGEEKSYNAAGRGIS